MPLGVMIASWQMWPFGDLVYANNLLIGFPGLLRHDTVPPSGEQTAPVHAPREQLCDATTGSTGAAAADRTKQPIRFKLDSAARDVQPFWFEVRLGVGALRTQLLQL